MGRVPLHAYVHSRQARTVLDPLTTFIVAIIYVLLSGAVLGFMHSALPPDLQPSAADWRTGTLLIAGGGALFVGQSAAGATWVIPISNACWLIGLALYWRAIRRFFGLRDTFQVFAPAVTGIAAITFFAVVHPSLAWRVNVATLCWVILLAGSAWTLISHRDQDDSISGKVLSWIFIGLAVLFLARGIYYLTQSGAVVSISAPGNVVNILSPLLMAVLPIMGTTVFVLLCFERIRRVLHRTATTDELTGLPNRRTIGESGTMRFDRANSLGLGFSIAVVDIDHFKRINDQCGHDVGDAVLRVVAATLADYCRGANIVGRHGGEEFVALFDDAGRSDALVAAERLRAAVEMVAHQSGADLLRVTVSIGVATFAPTDQNYEAILQRADRALYAAKAAGRNCTRYEANP